MVFAPRGQPGTIEKLNDYTVRFVYAEPHALFLQHLARPDQRQMLTPRHYLEQFHKDYNSDVDSLVEEESFADWMELFESKNDNDLQNPDRPVLNAWTVVQPVIEGTGRGLFERNPYYWKVDPDGSQLPYIDEISYELINDTEVALLRTTNGEIDFNHPTFTGGAALQHNKPVLAANREEGGFDFIDSLASTMNEMVILLNLNHEDPPMREMFQNKDFRIGLSHAIDREEIIAAVYQRQGQPWQAGPREESEFYHEELAKQFTEYDVDLANEYLDRAGYDQRDDSGNRLGPDGERISFSTEVVTEEPGQISSLELIQEYWREVGVDMRVSAVDRTLYWDRVNDGNLHDVAVWTGDGGYGDELLSPGYYFPASARWAFHWNEWYVSSGEIGEEPPEPGKQQIELYRQVETTVDPEERHDLFMQLLEIAKKEFWVLGIVLPVGNYGTVTHRFRNVPDFIPASWNYPSPGPTRPEQHYISEN